MGNDLLEGFELLVLARVMLILPLVEVFVPGVSCHLYKELVPFIEFNLIAFGFNLGSPFYRGCSSLLSRLRNIWLVLRIEIKLRMYVTQGRIAPIIETPFGLESRLFFLFFLPFLLF